MKQVMETLAKGRIIAIVRGIPGEKIGPLAQALFAGGADDTNMPTTEIATADVPADGIAILDLMSLCGLIPSKSEGRRLVQQGGVAVNDEKVDSIDYKVSAEALQSGVKIRKGKKKFHKAVLK